MIDNADKSRLNVFDASECGQPSAENHARRLGQWAFECLRLLKFFTCFKSFRRGRPVMSFLVLINRDMVFGQRFVNLAHQRGNAQQHRAGIILRKIDM